MAERIGATRHTHRSGPADSAGTVLQATSLAEFTGRVARWTLAGGVACPTTIWCVCRVAPWKNWRRFAPSSGEPEFNPMAVVAGLF